MPNPVVFSTAVEGLVDEAVARRVITFVGGQVGTVYGRCGKIALHSKIKGYNNAAKHSPWLILVDLDGDADCAPPLCREWLPAPAPMLCFRVAVRQVEAWLMADAESLAGFFSVAKSKVPGNPETLSNAKFKMVDLARHSRRSAIRKDMVPREGSGRSVGPAYSSGIIEFVDKHWRPDVAAKSADSLARAMTCLNA